MRFITEPDKMLSTHAEKQGRLIRKNQVAKYLTMTGRKGDAEPLAREWEKARDEAQVAQERFRKADADFVTFSGKTWSENTKKEVEVFVKEKRGHFYTTEMSHSPLFVSNVSEVMLSSCEVLSVCVEEHYWFC